MLKPPKSCTPRNGMACLTLIAPRAMGRSLVLATCGSRLRSHRSLMVQPAPRIIKAPAKKRAEVASMVLGGVIGDVSGAASRVLKRQGRKR